MMKTATDQLITAYLDSPLGSIELTMQSGYLNGLNFLDEPVKEAIPQPLEEAAEQLRRYFAGTLKQFNLPIRPEGTPFQLQVWEQLITIPYGEIMTYGEIAARFGMRNGARAVGLANGANPISIIVPCHRVIGAGGKLTGYGGGLWRKQWLLKLEKDHSPEGLFR